MREHRDRLAGQGVEAIEDGGGRWWEACARRSGRGRGHVRCERTCGRRRASAVPWVSKSGMSTREDAEDAEEGREGGVEEVTNAVPRRRPTGPAVQADRMAGELRVPGRRGAAAGAAGRSLAGGGHRRPLQPVTSGDGDARLETTSPPA
jgi:hypothetical protein